MLSPFALKQLKHVRRVFAMVVVLETSKGPSSFSLRVFKNAKGIRAEAALLCGMPLKIPWHNKFLKSTSSHTTETKPLQVNETHQKAF